MIYTAHNALGSKVFALDPVQRIDRVTRIDTARGVLWQHPEPTTLDENGEILTVARQFSAIWPIFGDSKHGPVLFHCYGEQVVLQDESDLVLQLRAMREENKAQANALLSVLTRLKKLADSWNSDGLPPHRFC